MFFPCREYHKNVSLLHSNVDKVTQKVEAPD